MGLCWSANTEYHGKKNFPYREAAPLSIRLWMRLAGARVIIQIVYSEESVPRSLEQYKERLESLGDGGGAVVVKLVRAGDMDCVERAQIGRMFAYEAPEVADGDVVMAADVDAFIMSKKVRSRATGRPATSFLTLTGSPATF